MLKYIRIMVLYECDPCFFATSLKNNFTRHEKTKKHRLVIEEFAKKTDLEKIYLYKDKKRMNIQKKMQIYPKKDKFSKRNEKSENFPYKCENCNTYFNTKGNKNRHQLLCNNGSNDLIIELKQQNELVKHLMEQNHKQLEEKYETIIAEKEKCINLLKSNLGNVTNHNTLNLIRNNIYTMKPLTFLNTFCKNNPSLEDVINYIKNGNFTRQQLENIKEAHQLNNKQIIAKEIDNILKKSNLELSQNNNFTCENVLFTNDGSNRRFIAKGPESWQFFTNDEPLDKGTVAIIDKVNELNNSKVYYTLKERRLISNKLKKINDYNNNKDNLLKQIKGDEMSIENSEALFNEIDLVELFGANTNETYYVEDGTYSPTEVQIEAEEEEEEDNYYPKYDSQMDYEEMRDCDQDYYYDTSNNVFSKMNKQYVGVRVHDEQCNQCNDLDQLCWYYIKYLNEI
jgi:hypothetical protein